jgi:hypothetical protein
VKKIRPLGKTTWIKAHWLYDYDRTITLCARMAVAHQRRKPNPRISDKTPEKEEQA